MKGEGEMGISVRISTGGVVHMLKHNGMTLCGKHFHSGSKGNWDDKVTCKSCIKIEAAATEARRPVKIEAAMQAEGARMGRQGSALMGNVPTHSGEAAKLAFVHGWMTHHESCDCKISGGIGYTYDLATHTMIKNPPARKYTAEEDRKAQLHYGLIPATWRSKHKSSKGKRVLSHA